MWESNKPKIGIRPIIDGRRRGIRESLEERTYGMALQAAKLISENLKYPDGTPVDCVVADTCIGGVKEAANCAEKFARENVGASLSVTTCWCYGSETMDMDRTTPKAVWGFNGTERPGAVYLAAVLAAHNQKGIPAFSIYGKDVQDVDSTEILDDVREKILLWAKAALAVALMKGRSYLAVGGVSMGIAGSIVNPGFFEKYLGMRVESVESVEFLRRIKLGIFDSEEYEMAREWVRKNCVEGEDQNKPENVRTREQKDSDWDISVKMAMIMRDLMEGNDKLKADWGEEAFGRNAILAGFQGQRQWTDFLPNGDFMEAISNSSFDWNGVRAPALVATENDSLNAVSMLFGFLLTNSAQVFCDLRTYWSPKAVKRVTGYKPEGVAANGFLHFINSGSAALDACGNQIGKSGAPEIKPWYEVSKEEAEGALKLVKWYPGDTEYFRGGGWSSKFCTREGMKITMLRLNIVDGLGPCLQLAEGWSVELPKEVHEILDRRTNYTWPTTWFAPRLTGKGAFKSVYDVMNSWGANHCSFASGHIGAELITLCSMLRIPVCMHNVSEEKIFRPSAWNSFGVSDPEGADFRACANYGALYK